MPYASVLVSRKALLFLLGLETAGKKCEIQNIRPSQAFISALNQPKWFMFRFTTDSSLFWAQTHWRRRRKVGLLLSMGFLLVYVILHTNAGALRTPGAHSVTPRVIQWTPCIRSWPWRVASKLQPSNSVIIIISLAWKGLFWAFWNWLQNLNLSSLLLSSDDFLFHSLPVQVPT